jgi:hypothetical protein
MTSDGEFVGFSIARYSKDILATLSDATQANPISELTKNDAEDWTDTDKDILVVKKVH